VPKQLYFWVALLWTGMIAFFCLMKSSAVPAVQIANLDKMAHAFFHFVFTLLWFLYFKNHFLGMDTFKKVIIPLLLSIFFGLLIELFQNVFTTTRVADGYDVLANTFGAIFAVILILLYEKYRLSNEN
jgi:VanZ family protein